ncbi:Phage shock protein A, PspA [Zostera marina]|uniref:Phage shock protein A, PspA n=2 Tax=Magnoliopsida TaxID=3398 RepID=A0A0K9PL53_ZOSMR|nr:Phage shock protein A, PspA [Zostera marina]
MTWTPMDGLCRFSLGLSSHKILIFLFPLFHSFFLSVSMATSKMVLGSFALHRPSCSPSSSNTPPGISWEFRGLRMVRLEPKHGQTLHFERSLEKGGGRQGGGSIGSQMNLFSRFSRVVKSYANALLSSVEDPEKILEQAVLEMNDDLTKMRQATAQVIATQKRLGAKYKASQQASEDWYRRAQLALEKGEESLAREALKRRKTFADDAASLKSQLDQQKTVVDNLVSNSRVLESKIQEAKSKKDTLKARAQSAKTATKVSEMVGNLNSSNALSAFEKMEEKVMVMESQADALNQLTGDDLDGQFALLETTSVDDDFAKLKKELSGSSSVKGELPSSRTNPFPDMEIESELNELRKKSKEM